MKRNSRKICLILLVLILTFSCALLTSCSRKGRAVTFTVDGAEYKTITTAGKESITLPDSPTKEGYTFGGWFEDDGVWSKPFTADSLKDARLRRNLTVYAKWNLIGEEGAKYTISFVGGEGATGTAPQVQDLTVGTQFTLPGNPFVKEGHIFGGWSDGSQTHAAASSYTVPTSNVTFTAMWLITQVDVTFDVNGGLAITPLELDYGSTLTLAEAPKAVKENLRFAGWYLNEELTEAFAYGAYKFTADTVLYADYREAEALAATNYYGQEEALIASQPTEVSFTVTSATPLTAENLSTYVTVTSDKNAVPSLNVADGEEEGEYIVSPAQPYDEGGEYKISVKEGLMITAQIRDDEIQVYSIIFRIAEPQRAIVEKSDRIIEVGIGDYYSYTNAFVGLKQQFVFDKEVKKGSILCISDADGRKEHYKAGTITLKNVGARNYYEVQLLPCELYEVYDNLDVTFNKSATFSDDEIEFLATQDEVREALLNNADYLAYQGLIASALKDYAVSQGMAPLASIENKKITFSFETGEEGSADYAEMTLSASFKISFSEDTYAMVTIEAVEKVIVDFTGKAKAFADVFNTEGGSWYDIDLLTILRSETTLRMNVILTNDGKTFDIVEDLDKLIKNYDPDSFVELYKDNLSISGDELTVIDFQVCRLRIPFEVAEIGVPISFRTKLDVNSPFNCDISVIIEKGYTIKGTQDTELTREASDRLTNYSLKFGNVGFLSVSAGIAVGIEVSFINLSSVGVFGLEVEVGAYLDYYGYGKQDISGVYMLGSAIGGGHTNSGNAVYYYEFGMYLDMNAYVRSKLFRFDYTVGLYSKEFPLFDGGSKYAIVGFNFEDDRIITSSPELDLCNAGLTEMIKLDLTTGETSTTKASKDEIIVYATNYTYYDEDKGTLNARSYYVNHDRRIDTTLTFNYKGTHCDLATYYMRRTFEYTYLPAEFDIAPEDVDNVYDVTFKLDGVTIATQQVQIGKYITGLDEVFKAVQEYDENILHVYWENKTGQPVLDDVVINSRSVNYRQGEVTFKYMVKGSETSVGYRTRTLQANVGTKVEALLAQVEDFSTDVDGLYRFTGWDNNINVALPPLSFYEGGKDLYYTASYEAVPFDYTILLGARYDANDTLVEDARVITRTYVYGDIIDYTDDAEMQRLGYKLDLVGDNNVSYDSIHVAYGPVVVSGTYALRNDLSVKVYADYSEEELIYQQLNVNYGADLSDVLNDTEAIREYIESFDTTVYTTEQGLRYCRDFLGWANAGQLDSVVSDVRIYGLSETRYLGQLTYKVRFDAKGGAFPTAMEYTAINGIDLVPNDTLEEDFLYTLEPTFKSDDPQDVGYEYVFAGWYDNAELTGNRYQMIIADADKVMYAKYERQAKDYTVRVLADGYWQSIRYDADDNIIRESEDVDGLFEGDAEQYELTEITYSAAMELVDDIENGTVDSTSYPNFAKIPVPQNDTYSFSHWQVCVYETEWELVPVYKKADSVITINYHFGNGFANNLSHIYSAVIELPAEESLELHIDKLFTPSYEGSVQVYNVATDSWAQLNYCYDDDNYCYVPKSPVCWSKTENGTPISEDDYAGLTLVINGDDAIKTYDFYALYDAVPKSRTLDFIIETEELERWEPEQEHEWSVTCTRGYGTALTADMIPTATKDIPNTEIPYEYEFSHWVRMYFDAEHPNSYDYLIASDITYTTQELLALDNAFTEDVIFKAEFVKKTRYVTVTFDAGEGGHFASNNNRYRSISVPACVDVNFGETPVYNEVEGYYDYVFDNWSYVEPYAFQNGATVTARSRQVRNETPAPDTGITVSWMEFSGDIGSAHTDIPGFFYYPDEGRVDVYGNGLTFSGAAENIVFNIGSGNVSLKDLTLTANDTYAIYLIPAYENNMSGLNRQNEIPININVEGTVELKGAFTTLIGTSGNYEIHLNGIGQDAKLLLNHDSHEVENQNIELTQLGDYLFINNLSVDVNAKIHQTSTFKAFYLQHIYLTMTNSSIAVDVEGSVLSDSDTYENVYAFYIAPMFSEAVFLPDDFDDAVVVTGCEKLYVGEPDDESPIAYPSWERELA